MKAWCIWCEMGSTKPRDGMLWIHEHCFLELDDVRNRIKMVEKYLRGEMPRILKNGDKRGYESVEKFLVAMDDFNRRWNNSMKLIKELRK